jgi:hypothetical protein
MNKEIKIIVAIVVIILFLLLWLGRRNNEIGEIKDCPEEWYQNEMPRIEGDNSMREYFIYKGERRELAEFDLEWVKANCGINPQVVY